MSAWHDVLKWVDPEDVDILQRLPADLRGDYLSVLFKDFIVNRDHTEVTVCRAGCLEALQRHQPALTERQHEALVLYLDASASGRRDRTAYVGQQMGISQRAASGLITRAGEKAAKMFYIAEFSPYKSSKRDSFPITKRDVQSWMRSHPRECAGAGRPETYAPRIEQQVSACLGETRGDHALCWSCYQVYGVRGEWADWLIARAAAIAKSHRKDAIEALMRDPNYAGIDLDDWTIAA